MSMEAKTMTFTRPLGTFRDALRAYRQHKTEWQERVNKELDLLEEEIKQAKADPFYKVESA